MVLGLKTLRCLKTLLCLKRYFELFNATLHFITLLCTIATHRNFGLKPLLGTITSNLSLTEVMQTEKHFHACFQNIRYFVVVSQRVLSVRGMFGVKVAAACNLNIDEISPQIGNLHSSRLKFVRAMNMDEEIHWILRWKFYASQFTLWSYLRERELHSNACN